MEINQVYNVVNSMASQALGKSDLAVTDTNFVSVGQEILASDKTLDAFYKALADRIGRTEVSIREYNASNIDFLRKNAIEWGAALQKIYIENPEAHENGTWFDQNTPHKDPFEKFPLAVEQSFFSKMSTWECALTVPDRQLQTAFNSASNFAVFYNGLFTALHNSMEEAYKDMANLARASFIASRKNNSTGITAINVLTDYNTRTNASLTISTAMYDLEFFKYLTMLINLYSDRMTQPSRLFNAKGQNHHTNKDSQVLTILSELDKSLGAYLQADTYHNELVAISGYNTVPYWQAPGTNYSFEKTSSVHITQNEVESNIPYVLAVIHDKDAIGTTIQNRRTKSTYNARDEYNDYFEKADMGYYTDLGENGIIFYMAET